MKPSLYIVFLYAQLMNPEEVPNLFVFVSSQAPIAVLLRKEKVPVNKENWQMIKWNLETHQFTEGQWLLKKKLDLSACSISPDGTKFGWMYHQYHLNWKTHAGVSPVPYFTAILYSDKAINGSDKMRFDDHGSILDYGGFHFEQTNVKPKDETRTRFKACPCPVRKIKCKSPSTLQNVKGCVQPARFTIQTKCRNMQKEAVEVRGHCLFVNGQLLYDATHNVFRPVKFANIKHSVLHIWTSRETHVLYRLPLELVQMICDFI